MCVSAMVEQELRKLEREYEAITGWVEFIEIFERRVTDDLRIPKALELQFEEPKTPDERRIKDAIDRYRQQKSAELETELFKQKKRLADAERALKTKTTKKLLEEQRIASNKVESLVKRISDINRKERIDRDGLMFPFYFVPIIVNDGARNKIIPARYHCRPDGKPAFLDRKFPGLYNARRDSLEDFWKGQFGKHHATLVISSFYENVSLHKYEHRELRPDEVEQNLLLHFNPMPRRDMAVACLWSHWQSAGESDLRSFAAITDEPTPEIAAVGHDRVVITLKHENVNAWLAPQTATRESLYALFDARDRLVFEHRKAA